MKKIFSMTLILMASFGASFALADDLIETAATSGEIKTFVNAVKTAGLTDMLKNTGPYTVFAPANSAFNKLPPDTRDELFKNKKKLAEVVSYHVIPGKVLVADVKPGKAQTIQGGFLTIKSDNGKVTVDEANVTQSDIVADNGVIHIIDTVIFPKP